MPNHPKKEIKKKVWMVFSKRGKLLLIVPKTRIHKETHFDVDKSEMPVKSKLIEISYNL